MVQFTPAYQTRHRQDRLVVTGVVVWNESARPPDKCVLRRSVGRHSATAGRTQTQNALGRSGRLISHCHTRHDKTVTPACRPPSRRMPGRQHAAIPRRPTARTQRRCTPGKCKHAVDCCIWLNLNFFTKPHATRVIYWLTVQTARRSWDSIHTAWHDTDSTVLSCLAGGVNWT